MNKFTQLELQEICICIGNTMLNLDLGFGIEEPIASLKGKTENCPDYRFDIPRAQRSRRSKKKVSCHIARHVLFRFYLHITSDLI